MHFSNLVAIFALLVLQVLPQSTLRRTATICRTSYDSVEPQDTPTVRNSYEKTRTVVLTSTSTPLVTITPDPVVETSTITSEVVSTVTGPVSTDTVQTTVTSTFTTTTEAPAITKTETVTVRSTLSLTSTVTYATPFPPVQSTLPGSSTKKKRSSRINLLSRQENSSNPASILTSGTGFPAAVYCSIITKVVVIQRVTRTAPAKTITLAPSTSVSTSTVYTTITSTTYPPDVAITITDTVTITETVETTPVLTSTVTSTLISTVIGAIETAYPQCDAPNQASRYQGAPIISFETVEPNTFGAATYPQADGNARRCCVSCLEEPTCGATFVFGSAQLCIFLNPIGTCNANSPAGLVALTDQGSTTNSVVSNGICGRYVAVREV